MSEEYSRLFYRAIARIRAVGERNGVVLLERLRVKFNTGFVRANKLRDELIEAGVLREWTDKDFEKPTKKGNIIWKNLSKFRVPKEITLKEVARVKEERKKSLFPSTIGELQKRSRSMFRKVIRP